jgi:hypothetical protein
MNLPAPTSRLDAFVDSASRALIRWRLPLSMIFLAITVALGASALRVHLDPGFNKLIPLKHAFMEAFLKHSGTFAGANRILVNVKWKGEGDIYNAEFMKAIRGVTDDVFFTPGVNRAQVFSIFTPNVKYIEVTEEGFAGEVVIPSRFEADAEGLAKVRANVARSGEIGRLVANDLKAALVRADLLETDPSSGKKLDYAEVSKKLEEIRAKYTSDKIEINIIGFAKIVGEVMDGLFTVVAFFGIAFVVTAVLLFVYTRSLKLTIVALFVALLPVVWLLGILPLIGYGIDPMSILVPFLIFSIGVSHAVQMTNAWKQHVLAGESSEEASRTAFRNLAIPGTVALVTNALGFMVIMLIAIPIVHELGVTACIGVLLMIMTNKMILPIVLSHLTLESGSNSARPAGSRNPLWWAVSKFAEPRLALITIGAWLVLLAVGTVDSRQLAHRRHRRRRARAARRKPLQPGQRQGRRQLLDRHGRAVGLRRDQGHDRSLPAVAGDECGRALRLPRAWYRRCAVGDHRGRHCQGGSRRQQRRPTRAGPRCSAPRPRCAPARAANPELGLNDDGCKVIHLVIYLKDHQGATLKHVVGEVQKFIDAEKTPGITVPPGRRQRRRGRGHQRGRRAGRGRDAGRDLRRHHPAVLADLPHWKRRAVHHGAADHRVDHVQCADGLAGHRSEGSDAAGDRTRRGRRRRLRHLPVRAHAARDSKTRAAVLREAFYEAMRQRGTAAVFTAITMSIGVGSWAFAALKFQADMGVLLAFMFLVNVFGAIFLLPAMACWLNVKARKVAA